MMTNWDEINLSLYESKNSFEPQKMFPTLRTRLWKKYWEGVYTVKIAECTCNTYYVYNTVYGDDQEVPTQVKYFSGVYK